MRRRGTIFTILGAILGTALAACGPPGSPPPAGRSVVVEGPAYSFDTVVVRGAGCDPSQAAGVRLVIWPAGTQSYIELRAMGSAGAAVQPNGTVAATFTTPLLAPGLYGASLVCTASLSTNPSTTFSVGAGNAPAASVSVTSPVHSGGSGTLRAQNCGRSANGEIQAAVRVFGAGGSFSFYGTTAPDGSVAQGFSVPGSTAPGAYTVELNCGRNPSQNASTQLIVN